MPLRQPKLTAAADVPETSAAKEISADEADIGDRRLSVLVAEHNPTNRTVIGRILETAGYDAALVHDRISALQALERARFDVVLIASELALMNGEVGAEHGCSPFGGRALPAIALIADATGDEDDRCLKAGLDGWIAKPIEPGRLLHALDAAIARHTVRLGAQMSSGQTEPDDTRHAQLDRAKLAELESLAGRDFVNSLIDQFLCDASRILLAVGSAVADRDGPTFKAQAHALRSCAINLGAHGLFELCLGWRNVTTQDLARDGAQMLSLLSQEFGALEMALATYRAS